MVVVLCLSSTIFFIRMMPSLEVVGDRMHYTARIIPSYSLAASIYTDTTLDFLSTVRKVTNGDGMEVSSDPWDIKNNLLKSKTTF